MAFSYGCAGRLTAQNGGFCPGQCASIGQAGVFTMEPGGGVNPFTARCDADGFMKVLQIHDKPYTPTPDAIGGATILQCDGGRE